MTTPGFTAEASLIGAGERYQPAAAANINTGLVHPAQSGSISLYPRIPCLRWRCIHIPNRNPWCYRTLGFWNHVTHSCE